MTLMDVSAHEKARADPPHCGEERATATAAANTRAVEEAVGWAVGHEDVHVTDGGEVPPLLLVGRPEELCPVDTHCGTTGRQEGDLLLPQVVAVPPPLDLGQALRGQHRHIVVPTHDDFDLKRKSRERERERERKEFR